MNTINGITSVIDAVSILGFLTLKLGKKNINAVYVFMIFSLEINDGRIISGTGE